jgi:ABC-type Na+ efflux pump permease subunit
MMMQRMVSRSRLIVAVVVGLGLFLLFIGAAFTNAGHTQSVNNNLVAVWGPTFMAFGLFLLVGGLLFGAAVLEDLDIFVRLFLMILGFVAVLLILASPATFFP